MFRNEENKRNENSEEKDTKMMDNSSREIKVVAISLEHTFNGLQQICLLNLT